MTALALRYQGRKQLVLPVFVAIGIHIFMALFLLGGWTGGQENTQELEPIVPAAVMIQLPDELLPPPPEQAAPTAPEPEFESILNPEAMEQTVDIDELLKEPEPEEAPAPEQQDAGAEALMRNLMLEDFEAALNAETQQLDELLDSQRAQVYVAILAQRVERFWSRPPNTHRGTVAELRIQLVPTGEVVDVSLISSNGSGAFNYSVEQAVKRASPLPVPEESGLFERYFRSMRLVFDPQDLDG